MNINRVFLFLSFVTLFPFTSEAVKLRYPDQQTQSEAYATRHYSCIVNVIAEHEPNDETVGAGSGAIVEHNNKLALLTNRHCVGRSATSLVIVPRVGEQPISYPIIATRFPVGAPNHYNMVPDLALCFFEDPHLVRLAMVRYGLRAEALAHLQTQLTFESLTDAEIVGFGGHPLNQYPTCITTQVSSGIGTYAETECQKFQEIMNSRLDALQAGRKQNVQIMEVLQHHNFTDLIVKQAKAIEEIDNNIDEAKRQMASVEHKGIEALRGPTLATSQAISSRFPGHTVPGDSGGGVFINQQLIAINCGGGVEAAYSPVSYVVPLAPYWEWIQENFVEYEEPPRSMCRRVIDYIRSWVG